jgi:hypothetical protein
MSPAESDRKRRLHQPVYECIHKKKRGRARRKKKEIVIE